MTAQILFDDVKVGDEIPSYSKVVERENVKAYADASGDQNPLHQDDNFARSVGFVSRTMRSQKSTNTRLS